MLTKNSSLRTVFSGVDFSKYSSKTSEFVSEFSSRANKEGKFLNWVNLPQEQLKRLEAIKNKSEDEDNIYTFDWNKHNPFIRAEQQRYAAMQLAKTFLTIVK